MTILGLGTCGARRSRVGESRNGVVADSKVQLWLGLPFGVTNNFSTDESQKPNKWHLSSHSRHALNQCRAKAYNASSIRASARPASVPSKISRMNRLGPAWQDAPAPYARLLAIWPTRITPAAVLTLTVPRMAHRAMVDLFSCWFGSSWVDRTSLLAPQDPIASLASPVASASRNR